MINIPDEEFDRIVEQALADLPEAFEPYLDNVIIEVCPRPDPKLLGGRFSPSGLLGLYIGHPLETRGPDGAHATLPDRILIFRENICRICRTRRQLIRQIRKTVLHEIGHHFGLDEQRLRELGYG